MMVDADRMPRHRSAGRDAGAVAVIVVIFALVMFLLIAFVVDLGNAYMRRGHLQNAADASALAGAALVCSETAARVQQEAMDYAGLNGIVVPAGDVSVDLPNHSVAVTTRETVPMFFGAFVGRSSLDVSAVAQAASACGLIFSVFGQNGLTFNGTASNGYTLYFGSGFTYNGGGQPSTFDGVYSPTGATLPANVTPSSATVVAALTTTAYYRLLYDANPTVLPMPNSSPAPPPSFTINPTPCVKQGSNPGVYASSAALSAAIATAGTVNCTGDLTGSDKISSATIRANVFVSGNIDISDSSTAASSRLIYSRSGTIGVAKVNSPTTVFFAELGEVTVSESNSNPTTVCTVIGVDARWNGGRQEAGCLNPILLPGSTSSRVVLTQ